MTINETITKLNVLAATLENNSTTNNQIYVKINMKMPSTMMVERQKISNFENSRWRMDLHRNVTEADASLLLEAEIIISTYWAIHLYNTE